VNTAWSNSEDIPAPSSLSKAATSNDADKTKDTDKTKD
jgi:hypothetical protein